jgi:HEPN domain-containing protein
MKKLTREWVKKAETDRVVAEQSYKSRTPLHDAVCFHCQQCAEKYLKALLQEHGLPVERIHDLDKLLNALLPYYPALSAMKRALRVLNDYAVDPRYPGLDPSKRQAASALRWMQKVRTAARDLLGFR